MSKILAIETTGKYCSISLFSETELLANSKNKDANQHSSVLHEMLQALLQAQRIEVSDLSAIALSKGPGSYTGLRIGSSSAKGLCVACNVPLISIASHEAMLYDQILESQTQSLEDFYCMTDARREDVFFSHYRKNKLLDTVKVINLSDPEVQTQLNQTQSCIIGSGATKAMSYLNQNHTYIEDDCLNACNMQHLAFQKFNKSLFEDLSSFEPSYEKEFYVIPQKNKFGI